MSQCMTIADETTDQKDTSTEATPKDIVEFLLEETLLSVFLIADKDCRLIGDFNITDDFHLKYDRLSYLKDFEQVEHSQDQSGSNQETNLNSGENPDRLNSLATAKENLEIIIDAFIKKEEKIKTANECTIITEDVLADSELQIKNGQIHFERNKSDRVISEPEKQECIDKKDVKHDKIEIEYYNEGKLSKIYVPLNPISSLHTDCIAELEQKEGKNEVASEEKEVNDVMDKVDSKKDINRPFEPFTTEELRQSTLQVWENNNSSLVGKWNGDVLAQKEEVVRLMEELSSVQVFHDNISDPNRPRACIFAEEDVKKMTKEIEEINFTQSRTNADDFDVAYIPDGQGDADLESKSFSKSKDSIAKPQEEPCINLISASKTNTEIKSNRTQDRELKALQNQSEELPKDIYAGTLVVQECFTTSITPVQSDVSNENNKMNVSSDLKPTKDCVLEEYFPHSKVHEEEECLSKSNLLNENNITVKASLDQVSRSSFSRESTPEKNYEVKENQENSPCASCLISKEEIQKTNDVLPTDLMILKNFQNDTNLNEEFFQESASLSGNIGSLSGSKIDEFTLKNVDRDSELDLKSLEEKSNTLNESQSVNNISDLTYFIQKNTVSLEELSYTTSVTYNILNPDSFSEYPSLVTKETEKKEEINDFDGFAQNPDSHFNEIEFQMLQNGENFCYIAEQATDEKENKEINGFDGPAQESHSQFNVTEFQMLQNGENFYYIAEQTTHKKEKKEEISDFNSFAQEPDSQFNETEFQILQNNDNSDFTEEKTTNNLEEALIPNEINADNLKEIVFIADNRLSEELSSKHKISINDSDSVLTQNNLSAHESSKSLNNDEDTYNTEIKKEPSVLSRALSNSEGSKELLNENGFPKSPEVSETNASNFKLHSKKMYFGANYDPAGLLLNQFTLLESEETLNDFTENIIQVIDPPDTSTDEDSDKISFSLLCETPSQKTFLCDNKSEFDSEQNPPGENEVIYAKNVYSGMTTVGPIKNFDYDPKDLIAPEIDYGKMTRITSSRQLSKDMSMFSSEVNTGISVKIIEENDSDDDASSNVEEDHLERNSLLNRDIASLTKVQKVREVMSHQPKSEEDFEDEDSLPRPRLDLKDVESMTDERYKLPEVSIPLLSFEIDGSNVDAGKDLIESMNLVISGLTNPAYYEEEIHEAHAEIQKSQSTLEDDRNKVTELSNKNLVYKKSSKTLSEDIEEEETSMPSLPQGNKSKVEFVEKLDEENELDESLRIANKNSQNESDSGHMKYSTLGSVFKKASSKIMRKDVDLIMRNSKSLPRDASKISTTDSIRSILDECQSSASNMLKKSRSLLKNTQSIFRSSSQSRMSSDRNLEQKSNTNKLSPSESDVTSMGKKFPSCLKSEYFTKTKISIKNMAEKTIRNFDRTSSISREPEITSEEKNPKISDRNEENSQVDRTENYKKMLPKNPLVYKSQFVRSQMSFPNETAEPVEANLECKETEDQQNVEELENVSQPEGSTEKIADEATGPQVQADSKEVCVQEKLQCVSSTENLYPLTEIESEPRQPDYIVMETIQGLPHADLESPSSEKENLNVENNENIKLEKENEVKKTETSNSLQIFTDGNRDVAPCFPEVDEEKMAKKTPSERKIKAKKKKFTARFRSFWCSAFGRVKPQSKKTDLS